MAPVAVWCPPMDVPVWAATGLLSRSCPYCVAPPRLGDVCPQLVSRLQFPLTAPVGWHLELLGVVSRWMAPLCVLDGWPRPDVSPHELCPRLAVSPVGCPCCVAPFGRPPASGRRLVAVAFGWAHSSLAVSVVCPRWVVVGWLRALTTRCESPSDGSVPMGGPAAAVMCGPAAAVRWMVPRAVLGWLSPMAVTDGWPRLGSQPLLPPPLQWVVPQPRSFGVPRWMAPFWRRCPYWVAPPRLGDVCP